MAATDYDYQSGRTKILERAFRIIGAHRPGSTLPAGKLLQGNQALNEMLKAWQGKNIFLWTIQNQQLTTTASQITVDLPTDPKVIDIDRVSVVDSNNDLPIEIITWRKYEAIQNKTATGRPQVVALFNSRSPKLYFWPEPDAIYAINCLSIVATKDYDTSSSSTDFPNLWEEAIVFNLAFLLSFEYPGPISERQMLQVQARNSFKEAKASLRENYDDNIVKGAF